MYQVCRKAEMSLNTLQITNSKTFMVKKVHLNCIVRNYRLESAIKGMLSLTNEKLEKTKLDSSWRFIVKW